MKAPSELFESSSTELYLAEVQRRIASGEKLIELDFSQCQAVSAYTFARIISLQNDSQTSNAKITIVRMQPPILSMVKALHLDQLLNIN